MDEIHCLGEHNDIEDVFTNLEEVLHLAVKKQRESGDTNGALNDITSVINTAIGTDTPENSRASFMRAHVLEQAFDKARLIYKRAQQSKQAVACGIVSYFMGIKRISAGADFDAARAAELRSPRYKQCFHRTEEDQAEDMALASDFEHCAKEGLAKSLSSMIDVAILDEAERLIRQMKLDVSISPKILAAVSQPPNNPWEMFNAVMAALGQ